MVTPFLLEADTVPWHAVDAKGTQPARDVASVLLLLYAVFFLQVGDPQIELHPGPHLHTPVGEATLALGSVLPLPVDPAAAGAFVRSAAS